jgi:hypothetical protein
MVSFVTGSLVCLAVLQDVSTTGKFPITDPFFYRSYINIHVDESTWEEPTEPAFLPQVHAPLLPSPPLQDAPAAQPAPADIQSVDLTSLLQPMGAISLSDGNSAYGQLQVQYSSHPTLMHRSHNQVHSLLPRSHTLCHRLQGNKNHLWQIRI